MRFDLYFKHYIIFNYRHINTHYYNLNTTKYTFIVFIKKGGFIMSTICIDESSYRNVDGILFDKDGTVIDFVLWIYWIEAFMEALDQKTDIVYDKQFLERSLGFSKDNRIWNPKGPLAIGSSQDLLTILSLTLYKQGTPWDQSYQTINDINQEVEKTFSFNQHLKPVTGLIEFLDQARHHQLKMGIVTSDDHAKAVQHLDALGITKCFTSIIGHDIAPRGKPYPDMVYQACQQLNIQPDKTMIFGDSNGDMMLGKNSGLKARIGVIPHANASSAHLEDANHIISNYHAITFQKHQT